ncbi:helix-turn-helix domain-containing protein [Candidatus Desulforudis audaxviator]|uniref:helix-turn-helix domain-containing protein n=1 Tax=Candidatus Desulforudis audaxviator TaxID=471827 RepID=UPI000A02419E|nr:helix-turn-helix domain-containing protein [Candidatus Desulforudis audaxviator]AZK60254.1 Mobile element protein [Candidatus Desulforudis audaxviator]
MRVIRGYKFKLKTTPELQRAFATMAGHARFVWNKALRLNLDRLERQGGLSSAGGSVSFLLSTSIR